MGTDPSSFSARRLRENEDLMESLNRRMKAWLEEVRDEQDEDPNAPFSFFCECSDLDCRDRVVLEPRRFEEIHADPEQFVVLPNHEIPAIEYVVDHENDYLIVRKTV